MALNNHVEKFTLDMAPGGIAPVLNVSQGDIGRTFTADMYWAGTSYDVSGLTVRLRGRKRDNTVFDYALSAPSGSEVTFETQEQMTIIPGNVECELVFTDSNSRVVGTANFVFIVEESPYDPNALSESDVVGLSEMVSEQVSETIADDINAAVEPVADELAAFEYYVDGRVKTPAMELGDIYVNGSGVATYYDSTSRIRTKRNTSISLDEGVTVKLSNYDGYRFLVIKGGEAQGNTTSGWLQHDYIVPETANYRILITYLPEATITDVAALNALLVIEGKSAFKELVNNNEIVEEYKTEVADVFNSDNFERGDLYVNGSGVGTYYDSNTRVRSKRNNPFYFRENTFVGLSDFTDWQMIVRRKEQDNTYTQIGTDWVTSPILVPTSGQYEILFKYVPNTNLQNADEIIERFFYSSPYGVFRETTNVENKNDIYKDELIETINTAREKTTSRALMFGVITDTHLDTRRFSYYNQTMENLERLNNGLQLNGIFHLGDIINGYDKATIAKSNLEYAVDRLTKINSRLTYITVGNHDNNSGAGDAERLKDVELYSYIQRFNEQDVTRPAVSESVYEGTSSNYYVDYPSFKIRMIMFDSCYYSNGFSDDTIAFVRSAMANAPADYHFMFFTHMSTEAELNGGYALGNATTFKNLLAEYKSRIYCYIHGHSHFDYVSYVNEFVQVALCCAVPDQPVNTMPSGASQPSRTIGTVTQDCISVLVILPDEGKIELVRFGAGENRSIPFRNS